MVKLSTIEDVERERSQEEDALEMQQAQEALRRGREQAKPSAEQADGTAEAASAEPEHSTSSAAKPQRAARSAAQEEDFHGLSSSQRMGIGQKILIVAAVIVCIAAVLYVVNSWVHFIQVG